MGVHARHCAGAYGPLRIGEGEPLLPESLTSTDGRHRQPGGIEGRQHPAPVEQTRIADGQLDAVIAEGLDPANVLFQPAAVDHRRKRGGLE